MQFTIFIAFQISRVFWYMICHKIPGHYYVDLLGATFSIILMYRGRREVNLFVPCPLWLHLWGSRIGQAKVWIWLLYHQKTVLLMRLLYFWVNYSLSNGNDVYKYFVFTRSPRFHYRKFIYPCSIVGQNRLENI